jgi:hypothetical protein
VRRLERQERESRDWVYRRYNGDTSHPRYYRRIADIDRKFAHKRNKVERRAARKYRQLVTRYDYDYVPAHYYSKASLAKSSLAK